MYIVTDLIKFGILCSITNTFDNTVGKYYIHVRNIFAVSKRTFYIQKQC